ncbi:unnamed protein product [Closterium sp. Yama58-4]|nr:unnamed protein product [Closterium sp. Yama58-4]
MPASDLDCYSFGDEPSGVRSFPSAFEIEQADAALLLGDEDYYRNHMSQARMTDSPSSLYTAASPASSTYFQGASDSEPSQAPSASSGVRSALQGWMSRRQSAGHQSNPTGSSSFHSQVPAAGTRGNPYGAMSSSPQLSRYSVPRTRPDDRQYPSRHDPHQAQPSRPDYYQQQQQQQRPSNPSIIEVPAHREQDPQHVLVKRKLQGVQASDQRGSSSSRAEDSRLSWTPSDKRAREVLAYERAEGDGKQCKLVWKKPRASLD